MFLLIDNSDSSSIVEQSQQEHDSSCNPLLTIIPSSVMYPMPYACQLAFSNVSISCSIPQWMFSHLCVCQEVDSMNQRSNKKTFLLGSAAPFI